MRKWSGWIRLYRRKKETAKHGTFTLLYAQGRFEVITVPEETLAGRKVSSTRIRAALQNGEMADANRPLGYPYEFEANCRTWRC